MEAMILAAGLGTRLRPLTENTPKALVKIAGIPALEHVAQRLINAGATRLIINVHHHADQIRDFLASRDNFGVEVSVSEEIDCPLDTGGGVKHAQQFFRSDRSFLLHNVDILSDINLGKLYAAHEASDALATLAVMNRETSRYLLFDEAGLCGYGNAAKDFEQLARPVQGESIRLGFCGVHAISPRIWSLMTETGIFSIITLYMRLAATGKKILPYRVDGAHWIDIGTPEKLAKAEQMVTASQL